tara:strand:- start:103 stop:828 length:726 start_codon:yes stop_codon:yes gene_type:complete
MTNKLGINLGCGDWFSHPNWIGLDEINGSPIAVGTKFPCDDSSLSYAYTSHFLEHIDVECSQWVFEETHRVLKPGGTFWIVVPNASLLLERYKSNDVEFYDNIGFMGREEWPRFDMEANLENRLLHFLCNYDNSGDGPEGSVGFFRGPPKIDSEIVKSKSKTLGNEEFLEWALSLLPPPEPWIKYQHINWWSYSKMQKMLAAAGFNNITKAVHGTSAIEDANEFDKEANRSTYSLYVECEK